MKMKLTLSLFVFGNMLKWIIFRPIWHRIVYYGKLFLQIWITFTLIYLLLVKDCFKILQGACRRMTQRFFWLLKELCCDNLWQALLEEAESDNVKPQLFQSKDDDIYLCQSCRGLNKSFLLSKPLNLKIPIRRTLSDSANIRESMLINQINSSRVLNIRNVSDESSKTKNTFFTDKNFASVCCQCEPSNVLNNQNLLSCNNVYNYSKNKNKVELCERRNLLKEASTSPFKCEEATPESVKFKNKIYDERRKKSETKLKSAKPNTPLNSPSCLVPILETPIKELNTAPRKSRLELMFSSEKHLSEISSEKESTFKQNWYKWKHFSKFINFKKKNGEENLEMKSNPSQIEPNTLEERSGVFITMETPEVKNCCGIMLCRLKTKFNQHAQEGSVTYKKF